MSLPLFGQPALAGEAGDGGGLSSSVGLAVFGVAVVGWVDFFVGFGWGEVRGRGLFLGG